MENKKIETNKSFPKSRSLLKLLGRVWSVIFLIGIVSLFFLRGVNFFTAANIQNVLLAATHILITAVGLTFVIIAGGIDISSMYVIGLSSVIGAIIMRNMYAENFSQIFVILIGVLAGLFFGIFLGFINGIIITKIKIPPFVTTLAIMVIAQGVVLILSEGLSITGLPPLYSKWGNASLIYYVPGHGITFFEKAEMFTVKESIEILSMPVLILIVILLIMGFILSKTVFGQHIYAIGGNVEAARVAGIPVDRVLLKVYMIAGLMNGVTGMVYVSRFRVATPQAGEPLLMSAIAAVFIGGCTIGGGYGSIAGTALGALLVAVLQTGLIMAGISAFWQYVAVGLVVLIAVIFDKTKAKWLQE